MIEYEYDEVVVGGNISSLIYAHQHGLPLISSTWDTFSVWDQLEYDQKWVRICDKLHLTGTHRDTKWFPHNKMVMEVGLTEIMSALTIYHGMSYPKITFQGGLVVMEDGIKGIASNKHEFLIKANTYHIVDPKQIRNNTFEPCETRNKNAIKVIDRFEERRFIPGKPKGIMNEGKFVKEMVFDGSRIYAISYLKKRDLKKERYADYSARFVAQDLMKSVGLKGPKRHDRPHIHRGVSLRHKERLVEKLEQKCYKTKPPFVFHNFDEWEYMDDILDLDLPEWD